MRKLIVLTLAVLTAVTLTVAADGQADIEFVQERQWIVLVDGEIASYHPSKDEAATRAADDKRANPDAHVVFTTEVLHTVVLRSVVDPTPTPTVPTACLLYTSPSPRDATLSRMPSSA